MVDYTLTPNKSLVKPNRGTYVDTWDTPINNDWDYVDRALGGTYTVGVQAVPATPVVLTNDQSRYQQIKVSNQTADITITFPLIEGSSTTSVGGMWIIDNVSNTFDVNLTTLSPGTNIIVVKAGKRQTVFSNGSGIFFCDDSRITAGAGLTLTGNSLALTSPVTSTLGGTGFAGGFTSGQLLIGKADGSLARSTLTPGTNITIENGDGTIKINSTASGGGGVSSVTFTGNTGLTFTNTGTSSALSFVVAGPLGVGAGGTGATGFGTGGFIKSAGTTAALTATTINLASATDVGTSILPVINGGSGVSIATGVATGASNVLSKSPQIESPTLTGTTTTAAISASGGITSTGTVTAKDISVTGTSGSSGIIFNSSANQYINFNAGGFGVYSNGNVCSGSNTAFYIYGTPFANQTNFSLISDERTKKNVTPYAKSLNDVIGLDPVTFQYNGSYGTKDDGVTRVGLIAQQAATTGMSSIVAPYDYTDPKTGVKTTLYTINPSDLMFAFINAIKALEARVSELEAKVGP